MQPSPKPREFGPEYGPEARRQLEAGFPIVYLEDGILIEEQPDGRRFRVCRDAQGRRTLTQLD